MSLTIDLIVISSEDNNIDNNSLIEMLEAIEESTTATTTSATSATSTTSTTTSATSTTSTTTATTSATQNCTPTQQTSVSTIFGGSIPHLECVARVLYRECAISRLTTLLDELEFKEIKQSQFLLFTFIKLQFFARHFPQVTQWISSYYFDERYHRELQSIWDECHYKFFENEKGTYPQEVQRFRIRRKHAYPGTIWNGNPYKYKFAVRDRQILEHFYDRNATPNRKEKLELAKRTHLSVQQIATWFKNRRNRHKLKLDIYSDDDDDEDADDGHNNDNNANNTNHLHRRYNCRNNRRRRNKRGAGDGHCIVGPRKGTTIGDDKSKGQNRPAKRESEKSRIIEIEICDDDDDDDRVTKSRRRKQQRLKTMNSTRIVKSALSSSDGGDE